MKDLLIIKVLEDYVIDQNLYIQMHIVYLIKLLMI